MFCQYLRTMFIGTAHNRQVEALLTAQDGKQHYVVLGCQRQLVWCDLLADSTTYLGKLNDNPNWLANYQPRPVHSYISASFRPNGKKKVTYAIEYSAKVGSTSETKPDYVMP